MWKVNIFGIYFEDFNLLNAVFVTVNASQDDITVKTIPIW